MLITGFPVLIISRRFNMRDKDNKSHSGAQMQHCCKSHHSTNPPTFVPAMNKKKLAFLVGFFVLLFLGFYFALTKIIPGFGSPEIPVLSYVPPFSFVNQEGRTITN